MPVDFFSTPCANLTGNCELQDVVCGVEIISNRFGISDEDSNSRLPAKVLLDNEERWDFTVTNPDPENKPTSFKAVDFCIDIFRTGTYSLENENRESSEFRSAHTNLADRGLIKRCEGFLRYEGKILFIEIKNRPKGNWLKDAREKFEETILSFKEHHPNYSAHLLNPIVSNKMFNRVHQNEMVQKKILKEKVGLELKIQTSYTIPNAT